jgi:pyruvate dehydrogenase (quinone)/pyruvate oxidase
MATTAADVLIDTIHDWGVEAVVDPFEPPMPPKITLDQATKFAESLARGEPNRTKIALTVLADKVRELI